MSEKYNVVVKQIRVRYPNTFVEVEINGQVTGVGFARYNREDERAAADLRERAQERRSDMNNLVRTVWSLHDDSLSDVVLDMAVAIAEEADSLFEQADRLTWDIEVGFNLAYSRAVRDGKKVLHELAGPASAPTFCKPVAPTQEGTWGRHWTVPESVEPVTTTGVTPAIVSWNMMLDRLFKNEIK